MKKVELGFDPKSKQPIEYSKDDRLLFPEYHKMDNSITFPSIEQIACEAQLSAIGVWESLNFNISGWENDRPKMKDWWRPFQPKVDILNDRDSVLIYGAEGSNPWDPTGLSHIAARTGNKPREDSMTTPTIARDQLSCMRDVFNYFDMARTFLIRLNAGGHYPPHRDHILLTRPTFRLIAFLGDSTKSLHWEIEDKLVHFSPNTVYYVDTRKMHRLWSAHKNSTMVVMNVIKNWENVMKLMTKLEFK